VALSCSLQVEQRDKDRRAQTCVLHFQALAPGLAEKNDLLPGEVYVTLRKTFATRAKARCAVVDHLCKVLVDHPDVLGPVPGVDVMARRSQGLLNVGTLSARMAVLRSCALDI
jgi:hypothetical protein